jgi:hypothetical protein
MLARFKKHDDQTAAEDQIPAGHALFNNSLSC